MSVYMIKMLAKEKLRVKAKKEFISKSYFVYSLKPAEMPVFCVHFCV